MESGKNKWENIVEDGLGRDLMNAGRFCFSCEQIFSSRKCREEHVCPATSFICSCGTEFTKYKDMLEHSTTHEPGHQVLDHETIRKRRMEKRKEEEEQLKRIETGEVVWKVPKLANVPKALPVKPLFQVPRLPQVPKQIESLAQGSSHLNPIASSPSGMKNIFADVGAPTVDLWTIYQPVVLLQRECRFNRESPYTCGKCGQCFSTKVSLISHHSTHVTDKVSGCIGCGLLLSSKKLVPRFHVCNSPSNAAKVRIITARPLKQNQISSDVGLNQKSRRLQTASSLEKKIQNLSTVGKDSGAPYVTSTLQLKNLNVKTYNQSKERFHSTSLQLKSQNPSVFKPRVTVSLPPKRQSPSPFVYNGSGRRLPAAPSKPFKLSMNSASSVWKEPTKTSPSTSSVFMCRVCHIPFETAQLLQRHKCVRAQEFMARHVHGGKQHNKLKRGTASPNSAQMNGQHAQLKPGLPASGNMRAKQVMTIDLDKGIDPVDCSAAVDMEDDCYIVESKPDKPSEMIYQVTSTVPIKT